MNPTRRLFALGAIACAALAATGTALAQFPDKPLRIVVGAPAGGTADIVARTLSEGLAQQLGQPVMVDNKPGGAGLIGSCLQARKRPVVFPRRVAFGEIVNDHQLDLCREMQAQGRIHLAEDHLLHRTRRVAFIHRTPGRRRDKAKQAGYYQDNGLHL